MTEHIYPLFGTDWSSSVPNEFKLIFNQSDVEPSNSRKQTYESIIIDEEYEIMQTYIQNTNINTCPLCYQDVDINHNDTQIYSCVLDKYYNIHNTCAQVYKQKTARLYQFADKPLQWASRVNSVQLEHDLVCVDDVRVFMELRVFHPISGKSLIHITNTPLLQHKQHQDNAIIIQDYTQANCQLYSPKKVCIPLQQGRMQVDINIMDPNLMQNDKAHYTFEFFYNITENESDITLKVDQLILQFALEHKTRTQLQKETGYDVIQGEHSTILTLKYISLSIDDLLKQLRPKQQTPTKTSIESFLFSPKLMLKTYTPQMAPTPIRARFQSLQLEESSQPTSPQEWAEDMSLDQLKGNIVNFVKTQHGSRIIQKYFTTCTTSELDALIVEIGPTLPELMVDPYANYMFGCLSQSCSSAQRYMILQTISPRLVDIACDKKGTHAIQSLVSLINSRQEEDLIENSIKGQFIHLVLDSQGTHLIKKIIARFSDDKLTSLFAKILDKFILVVNHQFGLCVLKDLMTRFKNNNDRSYSLLNRMSQLIDDIVQDPFGNYAIQHAIDTFGDIRCGQIIDRILQKLVQLSIHKYSSNVVEKCILDTTHKTQKRFIKTLSQDSISLELMKNKFGTFVLQKALQEAEKHHPYEYEGLLSSLNRNLTQLYAASVRVKWSDFLMRK